MDRITSLENEIANLRRTLQEKENELYELRKEYTLQQTNTEAFNLNPQSNANNVFKTNMGDKLTKLDIVRYSRQILLPDIGVTGQEKLCAAKVLVVGAGGLGCPAAMYLAGAGVGQIGIVDYDKVDLTNIHRQILHTEADQNDSKAVSATKSLRSINSHIKVQPYNVQLDSTNALDIASRYDVVLDCTDNVPTRYLLNDACAITKLPLISGSALKMEGQLTVYGYRALKNSNEKDQSYIGPCYRCVFPTPPPPETVGSCSANGVAGPVPGAIGCLQALEAIKLIVGQTHEKLLVERMLLFDGEDMTFRTVKLRGRNANCAGCSEQPAVSQLIDYEAFCKSQATEKDLDLNILPSFRRISPPSLSRYLTEGEDLQHTRPLLVDVRSAAEFNMCRIEGTVNWPSDSLRGGRLVELLDEVRRCARKVVFICRRGNDSQIAAQAVIDAIEDPHKDKIADLKGGLHAWSKEVDNNFPIY
ncbi:adenylyltransferase and sulfurtransferase MOCS3 isoform X2 [Ostrinia furnacalis]|uniref:adenylyltransferase and sulfurtransferase MOCS3 isoform X2 n=1 Tax=Ostrinia furnacalis TaxID=93504 RepID=UPI00103E9AC5|nr:adenylyltransferase and sulfurtransferase MOCS3 isoform X2 [Ostrinia furnacalis]